ncbi:MAG TPA: hypothetical protein ENF54_02715 [Desulfobacteraceae bacterium]|nr:hypothetical protein [Desulfobacteraceae bacterium]
MSKKEEFKRKDLYHLLKYILSYRPDEYGLVPESEGFFKIKELLWAVHEEKGFGYVRKGDIEEVIVREGGFEIRGQRIRANERHWTMNMDDNGSDIDIPSILYTPIRNRAHLHVLNRGLFWGKNQYIPLFKTPEFARRIGKRKDKDPVILEIMAERAYSEGLRIIPFGTIFIAEEIPKRYIIGPPVDEKIGLERLQKERKQKLSEEQKRIRDAFSAGTFPLRLEDKRGAKKKKGKKPKGWKEEVRRWRRRNR